MVLTWENTDYREKAFKNGSIKQLFISLLICDNDSNYVIIKVQ